MALELPHAAVRLVSDVDETRFDGVTPALGREPLELGSQPGKHELSEAAERSKGLELSALRGDARPLGQCSVQVPEALHAGAATT